MLKSRLRPYFDRCLVVLGIVLALSGKLYAQSEPEEFYDPNALVEVHLKTDPYSDYSTKKTNWSYRLAMSYESFYPQSYISPADGANYKTIFGNNQGYFATAHFGLQYNTRLAGIYLQGQYGGGSITGDSGTNGNMGVTKYGATIGLSFNNLGSDPWLSPYAELQVVYIGWNETGTGNSGVAAPAMGTTIGASLHLNKLDPEGARDAFENYGISNTALDIYAVQYATSSDAKDPDFQTTFNVGAGFHFEF